MTCVYALNSTLVPEVGFQGDIDDLYNESNSRSPENMGLFEYNCGGYALETYNWFLPVQCETIVRENAESGWLEEHGYEDYYEYSNDCGGDEYELQDYVERECEDGLENIYDILSEVNDYATDEEMDDAENLYWHHDYSSETALEIAALNILKSFPDMRRVSSFDELMPDEYGIAYRGADWDFHFAKYDQLTNTITHKLGHNPIKKVNDLDDAFRPFGYKSKTILFAKKRKVG